MKNRLPFFLLTIALAFLLYAPSFSLHAQVSTNLNALPATSAPRKNTHKSLPKPQKKVLSHSSKPSEPLVHQTAPGYTKSLSIPQEAPKNVVIAPPFEPVLVHPPVEPNNIIPVHNAHSQVSNQTTQGMRIQFESTSADMNDITIKAINQFGYLISQHPEKRLMLRSFAFLPGDDLSMPRRIALERALAVRSLLIKSGVATTRIYPFAQGRPDEADQGPTDRLDITIESNPSDSPVGTPVTARDTILSDQKGTSSP